MKCASIALRKIAFVLFILGTILCQTLNNNSQQSKKFYSPGELSVELEINENRRAKYTLLPPLYEDNATKLLITEGSSSTEGYGVTNEYPRQLAVLFGGNYYKQTVNLILGSSNLWTVRNVGNSGDTLTQITAQYATQVLPFYNPSLSTNYLTLQGGSNDVGKVSDYNNWLRAGNSGADFIIDLAAHPYLSNAANPTYFQGDGIHPNNAGQTIIAGIFADAIPTIAATSVVVAVRGRALTANSGRGIPNVVVSLTGAAGNTRMARTNSSGFFRFADVPAGETYIITAKDKRYRFAQPSQLLNTNNVTEVDFIANP